MNASSAPMIAHVDVYDRQTIIRLDFDIALTGFDVQPMRMSDIISGFLPVTSNGLGDDACQRNPSASVYPDSDGFLRVRPLSPATGLDNSQATTQYSVPAFNFDLASQLREDCNGDLDALAIGYLVIDHANYCNLSNPSDPVYYENDAIGMENNLWGEIIFTSGLGIPTYAMSTVNLEADQAFGDAAELDPFTPVRTFYARYWDPFTEVFCTNCGSGDPETDLSISAPWDAGFGDQREPLGLKWAARWFDAGLSLITTFRVWRSSPAGGDCDVEAPTVTLNFFDEEENTTTQGTCPSPCTNPTFNFPFETQQRVIAEFARPVGAAAGWVDMSFVNNSVRHRARSGVGRLRVRGRSRVRDDPRSGYAAGSVLLQPAGHHWTRPDDHPGDLDHPDRHRYLSGFSRVGGATRPLFFLTPGFKVVPKV